MTTLLKKPPSTHLISSPLLFFLLVLTILALLFSSLPSASSVSPSAYANGKAKVAKELNEGEALLKWKTSLDIKSQSLLSSWAGSTTCNWTGVNCDEFGSVTDLNLSSYGLRELVYTMEVNEKCHIFSFGVVILEIVMGKHPCDLISFLSLPFASSSTLKPHDVLLKDVLDQRPAHPSNEVAKEVVMVTKLALACLHANPQYRPTMQQVYQKL